MAGFYGFALSWLSGLGSQQLVAPFRVILFCAAQATLKRPITGWF